MLWHDTAFLAVVGCGSLFSLAHYLATVNSLSDPVPVHFNLCGVPDRFAAPWAFVLYPFVSIALGATAASLSFHPLVTRSLPHNSVEQLATRASVLCATAVILASQLYVKPIAEGSVRKLPSFVMGIVYGGVGMAVTAALISQHAL